jgi:tRNA(fMet)-specific endonuclease VapC
VKYLLDTNVVIHLLNNRHAEVRTRFRESQDEGAWFGISLVVLFELWFGAAWSGRRTENADRIRAFMSGPVDLVPFDGEDARIAGELRAALQRVGTPIGPYDLLIAAQGLRMQVTLVTANVDEFRRVPGLKWEDWLVPRVG